MSFPMSHLFVAEHILENIPINNISQYYLGTLAPDAVLFRKEYDRNYKRIAHLYIHLDHSDLENFLVSWKKNVICFFEKYQPRKEIFDFLLGYCIHLFADMYSHKHIWKVFESTVQNNSKLYQEESLLADLEIFQKNNYGEKLFPILERSESFDFFELLSKDDMEGLKNNILHKQYKNKQIANSSANTYITYNNIMEHNNKIVCFAKDEIQKLLKPVKK